MAMKRLAFALILLTALPLAAQVKFTPAAEKIDVEIDGKPFTTFYISGDAAPKPYLHPLRMADGLIVTRRFPMESVPGETKDHPHHRGLWFTHGDVNKLDFWVNEKSTTPLKVPRGVIKLEGTPKVKEGKKQGTIDSVHIWSTPDGKPLLRENRRMTFHSDPTLRMVDFDVTFTATRQGRLGRHQGRLLRHPPARRDDREIQGWQDDLLHRRRDHAEHLGQGVPLG